jgi:hypothetical protein
MAFCYISDAMHGFLLYAIHSYDCLPQIFENSMCYAVVLWCCTEFSFLYVNHDCLRQVSEKSTGCALMPHAFLLCLQNHDCLHQFLKQHVLCNDTTNFFSVTKSWLPTSDFWKLHVLCTDTTGDFLFRFKIMIVYIWFFKTARGLH